jgi:hypothetical protein
LIHLYTGWMLTAFWLQMVRNEGKYKVVKEFSVSFDFEFYSSDYYADVNESNLIEAHTSRPERDLIVFRAPR